MTFLIIYAIIGCIVSISLYITSATPLPVRREITAHTIIAIFWPFVMVSVVKTLLKD